MIQAKILLDSISPWGTRLTTMKVTMPRYVLAEFNTHRVFSRNAGSSRAIPISRRLKQVREAPYMPTEWGSNQKGMQAGPPIQDVQQAEALWKRAAHEAALHAQELEKVGVHKQIVNRLLEPFVYVDVIVSSTQWENFYNLRVSPMADPGMFVVASAMQVAQSNSWPQRLQQFEWHIPAIATEDQMQLETPDLLMLSAGRLARVSYEAEPKSIPEDIELAQRLVKDGHFSPFEHQAMSHWGPSNFARNFVKDYDQFRAFVETGIPIMKERKD